MKVLDKTSKLFEHLESLPEWALHDVCLEQNWIVEGVWPPLCIPDSLRKYSKHLGQFGNRNGHAYLKRLLQQKILDGKPNSIIIRKNVNAIDEKGAIKMPLGEEVLLPNRKVQGLKVSDIGNNFALVELTKPPKVTKKRELLNEAQPLNDNVNLKEYQKYRRFKYSPHRWPRSQVKLKNVFANPFMMEEHNLKSFTGLTALQFWTLVDTLGSTGIRPGKPGLSLPAKVLLTLMKLRKGLDNETLSFLFGTTKSNISNNFWRISIHLYDVENPIPRLWSKPGLTNEEIDEVFDQLKAEEDPYFKRLSSFFQDPKGQGRIPFVVCVDSTKLTVDKSTDFKAQKDTHFKGRKLSSKGKFSRLFNCIFFPQSIRF